MVNAIMFAGIYFSSVFRNIFYDLDETLLTYSPSKKKKLIGPILVTLTLPFKVKITQKWHFGKAILKTTTSVSAS